MCILEGFSSLQLCPQPLQPETRQVFSLSSHLTQHLSTSTAIHACYLYLKNWAFSFNLTKPVPCWNSCTTPNYQQAPVWKCGKCPNTARQSCSSGTSYMQFFHCTHNDIQQLKSFCGNHAPHGNIQCSSLCPHPCFRDGGNTQVIPKGLLSPCSRAIAHIGSAQLTVMHQLCQGAHQKENHHFLYNTTKQLVKLNTEVIVNGNQDTWRVGKCSQSK